MVRQSVARASLEAKSVVFILVRQRRRQRTCRKIGLCLGLYGIGREEREAVRDLDWEVQCVDRILF